MKKYLIIGGTGKTGRKVVATLQAEGHDVRIGSRSAAIPFDWQKPEGWNAALAGFDTVYITFQPDLAVPGAAEAITHLVAVAKAHQVKQLVLLSGKGEVEAQKCEQIVLNSGIAATIVRASWFSQNFSESFFLEPIISGVVALPKAEAKVPYVDTDDIAAVVAKVLTTEGHAGKIYELTGPTLLTFREVIEAINEATGRRIQFIEVSMEDYIAQLEHIGLPPAYVWLINYLFSEVLDAPHNAQISTDIETLLGRPATSFHEYVANTAKTGVWAAPEAVAK